MRTLAAVLAGLAIAVVPAFAGDQTIHATSDNAFAPADVTMSVGETVTIINESSGSHNVRWEDEPTARMAVGKSWTTTRRFDAAGTYRFYCEPHGTTGGKGMAAVVSVSAPTSPPEPTPTPTPEPSATPAPTGDGTSSPTTAEPAADRTPPRMSRIRTRATRRLLVVRLNLSEAAGVRAELRTGRRAIRRTFRGRAGSNAFRIRSVLAVGRLTVRLTATDRVGNASARRTLRLRVG